MAGVSVPGFQKHCTQNPDWLKTECHAVTKKYQEIAFVVQQVYKVLTDIDNLAGCTQAKVGERSEWTSIVNSTEEKRANSVKV
jgi:hypothetical protein